MVLKVMEDCEMASWFCHLTTGKLFQPSSKWVLFSNQGKIGKGKEWDGLCLSSAVNKIQWASTPTVPMAFKLWETFSFIFCSVMSNANLYSTNT